MVAGGERDDGAAKEILLNASSKLEWSDSPRRSKACRIEHRIRVRAGPPLLIIDRVGRRHRGNELDGRAELLIAGEYPDLKDLAARSAGIWIGLSIDDGAHAALRRDGLDPAALRLTGLHPFEFEATPDGALQVIARANDNEAAEGLLDLFRVYFLRRLLN